MKIIYKSLLFALAFLFIINSGYSAGYIDSCGTYTINASETYYINLTNPIITSGTSCILTSSSLTDVTFIQLNDRIDIYPNNFIFIDSSTSQTTATFKDFYVVNHGTGGYFVDYKSGVSANHVINFDKSIIQGFTYVFRSRRSGGGFLTSVVNAYNTTFIENTYVNYMYTDGLVNPRSVQIALYQSALLGDGSYGLYCYASLTGSFYTERLAVIGEGADIREICGGTASVISAVRENVQDVDANNDNIGDNDIRVLMHVDVFSKESLFPNGLTFIQDAEEYAPFRSPNANVFSVNSESVGSPHTLGGSNNNIIDTSMITLLFDNFYGIEVTTDNELRNVFDYKAQFDGTNKMYMQDDSNTFTLATEYKPLIALTGSNLIVNDLRFHKIQSSNNAHIIANSGSITYNNIDISENIFYKADSNYKYLDNYIIKVKANNLLMYNNNFSSDTGVDFNGYEFLYIEGSNPKSNKIYLNRFETITDDESIIFTDSADTDFYNNYLGENVSLTDATNNLNATPLIGFEHTDSKIYYYYIGNYYKDNTGCVDGDGNGFCDSSYTSGTYTDTNPLSSYPFVFTSHLLTADVVVDSGSFNINLTGVTNNQTIEVSGATSVLSFGFIQDSNFPDLTCDYYIDGSVLSGETITNAIKDLNYTINLNGWNEKSYTYRVECFNEFQYQSSSEVAFNIVFSEVIPPDENGADDIGDGFFSSVFDTESTTEQKTNSVLSLYGSFDKPLSLMLIIGLVFLGLVILTLLFSLLFAMLGGFTK